jgi:hypothetical protein
MLDRAGELWEPEWRMAIVRYLGHVARLPLSRGRTIVVLQQASEALARQNATVADDRGAIGTIN